MSRYIFSLSLIIPGKVLKVVREHYLRDDLWCGSHLCKICGQENSEVLDKSPVSSSTLCDFPHYLVIDTNVVLHQVFYINLFAEVY
jgi:exosome complex exonuclease DIS3/RRP44